MCTCEQKRTHAREHMRVSTSAYCQDDAEFASKSLMMLTKHEKQHPVPDYMKKAVRLIAARGPPIVVHE